MTLIYALHAHGPISSCQADTEPPQANFEPLLADREPPLTDLLPPQRDLEPPWIDSLTDRQTSRATNKRISHIREDKLSYFAYLRSVSIFV